MIKIGSRVRYIRVDNEDDKATGYYPPIGTLGTVINDDGYCYQVDWDSGTKGNGIYWCDHTDVEEELECIDNTKTHTSLKTDLLS